MYLGQGATFGQSPGQPPMDMHVHNPYTLDPNGYPMPGTQHLHAPHAQALGEGADHDSSLAMLRRTRGDDQKFYTASPTTFDTPSLSNKAGNSLGTLAQKGANSHKFPRPSNGSQSDSFRPHPRLDITQNTTQFRPASASSYDSVNNSRQGQNGYADEGFSSPQGFPTLTSIPPTTYNSTQPSLQSGPSNIANNSIMMSAIDTSSGYDSYTPHTLSGLDPSLMDGGSNTFPMSYWNNEGYGSSPRNTEDFVNLLFNESVYPQTHSPGGPRQSSMSFGGNAFMEDDRMPGLNFDPVYNAGGMNIPQQHPMALKNILDPADLHAILSEEKRKEVLDLILARFNDHSPVSKQKAHIFAGDKDAEGHVLSLHQMQLYIRSYWYHFHPQMPILHKPTFSADKAQNLLLIAVIAIGASCLDKMHGADMTAAGADFANFLAWHLRGEVFGDKDFTPPAQLWVFQTLLLLEVYEKMYSTRMLHERAHIHHGTTLTLMRRGPCLIVKPPLDSPPNENAGSETNGEQPMSRTSTPDEWWNHWVTNEATRRVAFAAFIVDSIHATMFGHQATMVAHEMKLALPCDESLWSAVTSAEVAKKESELRAKGVKSMTFFDGLKNTLKGKPVHTNSFGRTAIMAGLLSVTFHMNQRDVQIYHLGALKALGGKDVWRGPLTKAFDSWKQDFDSSIDKENTSAHFPAARIDEENIFESRVVLHHLSHMAMHVDIVSCQIFAGAPRLLGRTTLPADYEIAQKRIRTNWAPRASARHATFYAIKFLAQVLVPELNGPYATNVVATPYSPRDDFLLNRPWVLYFAMLVVWCYGYALDGALRDPPDFTSAEEQRYDMRQYLTKFGNVQAPQDLGNMDGRNACLGLLYVLQEKFKKCRWQLLGEASSLLGHCIDKLRGNEGTTDKTPERR